MILKVEMSLSNGTRIKAWTLSKGWWNGSSTSCYFMAHVSCSAGTSGGENQLQLSNDSCSRKPAENGNGWWFGVFQLSSFDLVAFWGSRHQCTSQCHWVIPDWGLLLDRAVLVPEGGWRLVSKHNLLVPNTFWIIQSRDLKTISVEITW